ncbi:MMPL family transporter [Halodesulfovibrio marinisediminis]|nr:MMPL family transporter [Halodesulfovibrio marinisediminis]
MNQIHYFAAWYHALVPHRRKLLIFAVLVLVCCGVMLSRMQVREDIGMILPNNDPELSYSLKLMELAPFSRMVFIQLEAGENTSPQTLFAAAKRLRSALPDNLTPCLPDNVLPDPKAFVRILPSLADQAVIDSLEKQLAEHELDTVMRDNYLNLFNASSFVSKKFIQYDPFHLLSPLYELLRSFRVAKDVTVQQGVLSKDGGRKLLLLVKSSVAPTDSGNAELMLAGISKVLRDTVTGDISTTVFSGHQFAVENARTIKQDLRVVLTVSLVGLLAIFFVFIRSRDILWVAAVPGVVLLVASSVLAVTQSVVSSITLGFGAVLLGISVDFALHVYFAFRYSSSTPAETLAAVARPVLFGGITSLAAFGALAFSAMPGIQQLAYFGIVGLCCGLVLALVLLPHCLVPSSGIETGCRRVPNQFGSSISYDGEREWNVPLCIVTCGVLAGALFYGGHVQMDNELRSLSVFPKTLLQAEDTIRQEWGGKNESAIFFAEGTTQEEALKRGEELSAYLRKHGVVKHAYSLSTVLPAEDKRAANRSRWNTFAASQLSAMEQAVLHAQSTYGFSPHAFDPFFQWMTTTPADIGLADLNAAGIGGISSLLYAEKDGRQYVQTLVPDLPEIRDLARSSELPEGIYFYSARNLGEQLGKAIEQDFRLFVGLAFASMAVLMLLFFRHIGLTLLAILPLCTGLTFLLCVMRVTGTSFNLFSIAALPLIIGLAADYGIFVVNACKEGVEHGTLRAVLVSGLTTVSGFGALVFAEHPAMYSLGITVLLGVGAAIPAALFLVPMLYRSKSCRSVR